ncbi:hypothetical protein [uncultured Chitinophaga sp.]|uniref:hypothetical protein n=1 Tax=uncultured Chitinophaga sp. TaxID=339340 RepID=UPI0025F10F6D|nr:hypothetical protein [uncultured Chitinophaga sp.]
MTPYLPMKKVSTLLLLMASVFSSCGFYTRNHPPPRYGDDRVYVPLGRKKERKLTFPTISFTAAMKDYRLSHGGFPQELTILEHYNEKTARAFRDMKEVGYTTMRISYLYLDSMEVDFIRIPGFTQNAGPNAMEMRITGKFVFTMKDSSMFTRTVLD